MNKQEERILNEMNEQFETMAKFFADSKVGYNHPPSIPPFFHSLSSFTPSVLSFVRSFSPSVSSLPPFLPSLRSFLPPMPVNTFGNLSHNGVPTQAARRFKGCNGDPIVNAKSSKKKFLERLLVTRRNASFRQLLLRRLLLLPNKLQNNVSHILTPLIILSFH